MLRAVRATIEGLPPGDYCGYSLYSDPGAMTVCCSVNTVAHLDRVLAEAGAEADGDGDGDGDLEYRWCPAQWAMEGIGHEHFEKICRRLYAAGMAAEGGAFVEFRDLVYETCVTALETLIAEGAFGTDTAHVVVFAVSDTEDAELETAWIRRLNPAGPADRFARWIGAASPSEQA